MVMRMISDHVTILVNINIEREIYLPQHCNNNTDNFLNVNFVIRLADLDILITAVSTPRCC